MLKCGSVIRRELKIDSLQSASKNEDVKMIYGGMFTRDSETLFRNGPRADR